MKIRHLFPTNVLALLVFVFLDLSSQVPQGFNYQAIAREGGNPVTTPIGVMLTIQSTAIGGTTYWIELHTGIQPNSQGLFTIVVGNGVKQAGSTANTFSDIDWSVSPKYLKTEINTGSGFVTMGTSQMLSVPYSLVAKKLGGPVEKLGVTGTTTNMEEPLFEVKNNSGQTVFAVYNEGVRVYVDNGSKGVKGGFAIGGFGTDKAASQRLFIVDPDSIRAYIDTNPAKGVKGGFAIGGFGTAKAGQEEYLRVTRDSTRIYLNDTGAKGIKGGFAIGGFDVAKGTIQDFLKVSKDSTNVKTSNSGAFTVANYETGAQGKYLNLTPSNYFIGHQSGKSITYGRYNFFLGYQSGYSTTGIWPVGRSEGSYNSFIGYKAGYSNTIGMFNLFIGHQAGYSNIGTSSWNGNYNSFLGYNSGYANITGYGNCFLGYNTGKLNTSGSFTVALGYEAGFTNNASNNVFVGSSTGYYNTIGTSNAFIGAQAGWRNTDGNYNVFLGSVAGCNNTTGDQNIYIGDHAGYTPADGLRNIFLGYGAGMNFASGSSNIFIGEFTGVDYDQGHYNIFIGSGAGDGGTLGDASGRENIFMGWGAGGAITSGQGNICLGSASGNAITTGTDNVFIGRSSGRFETTSNNFCIDIKQRTDVADQKNKAMFYGNFDNLPANQYLRINSHVGINGAGSASYSLYVTGNAYSTGTWTSSDARYKKSVSVLENLLNKVMQLSPVSYKWRQNEFPEMNFDIDNQIGFIAQDFENIFPDLVKTDEKGFKSISYEKIPVILTKAIQEQQRIIDSQTKQIEENKKQLENSKAENLKLISDVELLKSEIKQIKELLVTDNK